MTVERRFGSQDAAVAKEWAFHNLVLGAHKQVVAQFGDDSDEVQAIGLEKKSEYKAPGRNGKAQPVALAAWARAHR
jgi:hypothetical protein